MASSVDLIRASSNKRQLPWPHQPRDYQKKGIISETRFTTKILAHCTPKQQDVIIEIKNMEMIDFADMGNYMRRIQKAMEISSEHVLSPVAHFQSQSEIWIIYQLFVGGPLSELLATHYLNGMTDEDVVATILYDVAEGLDAIHSNHLVHCNIRPRNLHMSKSAGTTLLSNLLSLKSWKLKKAISHSLFFNPSNSNTNSKHKSSVSSTDSENGKSPQTNTHQLVVSEQQLPYTDPALLLRSSPSSFGHESLSRGDIYSFGILAMELCYGYTPLKKTAAAHPVTHAVSGSIPLSTLHSAQHSPQMDGMDGNHDKNAKQENLSTSTSSKPRSAVSFSDYPKACPFSTEFQDLVTRCVAPSEQRITLREILNHQWFTERRDHYEAVIQCVQPIRSVESMLKYHAVNSAKHLNQLHHLNDSNHSTHSTISALDRLQTPNGPVPVAQPLATSATSIYNGSVDGDKNGIVIETQMLSKSSVEIEIRNGHDFTTRSEEIPLIEQQQQGQHNHSNSKSRKESLWDFSTDFDDDFRENERPLVLEDIEYGDDDRKGFDALDSERARLREFDLYGHREPSVPRSIISKLSIAPSAVSSAISKLSPPIHPRQISVHHGHSSGSVSRSASFQQNRSRLPNIIKLSVGGTLFTTKRSTLQKYDTMLSRKFSGDFDAEYDEETDCYFIDRSGKHFEHILNYLRTGKLIIPTPFSANQEFDDLFYRQLFEEAQYFQIGTLIDILNPENVHFYSKILQSQQQVATLKQWVADPSSRENSIVPMSSPSGQSPYTSMDGANAGSSSISTLNRGGGLHDTSNDSLLHHLDDLDDAKEIGVIGPQSSSSLSTASGPPPPQSERENINVRESITASNSPMRFQRTEQNQRWRLIYRASDDGFEAHQFHRHCDLQGATVTLIHANNRIFGGYTDIPWRSDSSDKHCATKEECLNTFIFSMKMIHSASDPVVASKWGFREDRYHSGGGNLPVAHERNIGPAFGWYHVSLKRNNQKIAATMSSGRSFQRDRNTKDKVNHHQLPAAATISQDGIVIGNKCDVENNSSWTYCAYFDTPKDSKELAGTKYFFVKDIEVYQVSFIHNDH